MNQEQTRVHRSRGTRRFGAVSLVAAVVASLLGLALPQATQATGGLLLFYSWGQGTNTVSKMTGTTPVDTWVSGSTGSGAATAVTSDGTYVYWANGTKIFRQAVTAASGATPTPFIDISSWASAPFSYSRIDSLAVDSSHIYLAVWRNLDDNSILRADKVTGARDATWAKSNIGTSMTPLTGLAVSDSPTGFVVFSWSAQLGRATKTASGGQPTTFDGSWVINDVAPSDASNPNPLATDGLTVYYASGSWGVSAKGFSASGGPGTSVAGFIAPFGTKIRGLGYSASTGKVYAVSSVASGSTYTIYSATPDETTPGSFSSYATFSSTSSSVTSLVVMPVPAVSPTINTQPSAASKIAGQSVTFTVAASITDGGTLSYQWKKDGTNISGATSASYTKANLVTGDAGSYTVVVTNTLGSSTASTTSSAAVLTVAPAAATPTISTQPAAASKTEGESVTFSVSASTSDGGTLSYQWKKDGTDISGATSASYTKANLVTGDAGSYTVVVTNTLGASTATATSTAAALAVAVATTTTTTTTAPATTTTTTTAPATTSTTTAPAATTTTVPAPQLVTASNQAQLEAEPGEGAAVINGKVVEVEVVKPAPTNDPAALLETAKQIVSEIADFIPKGVDNPVKVIETAEGASLTGIMANPDNPKEQIPVPVESVTLIKAGDDTAMLVSALNQTNVPALLNAGGTIEVTRGGTLSAVAYGLPSAEEGEIVLMSTPRLLQKFTVDASGGYKGQVPLPKNIEFGSHTVVMATKNAKVSLGIKLVRTRLEYRIKKKTTPNLFLRRAGVKRTSTAPVTVTGQGRCRANAKQIVFAAKTGRCFITVKQAAQGNKKAIFTRFTVLVVDRPRRITGR